MSILKTKYCIIIIFYICSYSNIYSQQIKINEFMASNSNTITDPDYNKYSDWIELFNSSENDYNLKGCYITDNISNKTKFKISSDLIISAKANLIIWADDENTSNHTNFKLSASGEFIGLYNAALEVVDTITFFTQQSDISYGRFPDGSDDFYLFRPATPLSTNLESTIYNRLPDPVFNLESGFYDGEQQLKILCNVEDAAIYYTKDGSTPTSESFLFQNQMSIRTTRVIKAIAVKNGYANSKIITKTYLINEPTKLPVFSLSTDYDNFFSDSLGIYVAGTNGIIGNCSTVPYNWNQDWERPVTIELFEQNKQRVFCADAGAKIFGSCSRLFPQKSLSINFKNEFGPNKLQYKLFPDRQITEYDNFLLRNSGQDWLLTMFRDALIHTVVLQNTNIDCQAYRPAILFINGTYFGIHNLREKINNNYLTNHYQLEEENIDLIEYSIDIIANTGDLQAHDEMISFVENNDLADSTNYNYINSIIDIDEFIDYQICEIYCVNPDWPCNNTKLWHSRDNTNKWRWILFDMDLSFGGSVNGNYDMNSLALATGTEPVGYPNPPWSTLLFRKLLENDKFKNEFIQKFAAHINITFKSNYIHNTIDSIKSMIADELPRHILKWTDLSTIITDWDGNIQVMREFAVNRPEIMRNYINHEFNLGGTFNLLLDLNNDDWGKIYVQNIDIKNNFNQILFKNIPLEIKAVAMPGFRFVKWNGDISSTQQNILLNTSQNTSICAVFEPVELTNKNIVINEINYKSYELFDTGDWIELYNPLDTDISLGGWIVNDINNNQFVIPSETKIFAKDYLVICQDSLKFKSLYNNFSKLVGNSNFGLSSSEDKIALVDYDNKKVDEVWYNSNNQWPVFKSLQGRTLSLINPLFDNSLPENWKLSNGYGTPGYLNDTYTKTNDESNIIPSEFSLSQNYPNPFNPFTTIRYNIPTNSSVKLEVFNILGEILLSYDLGLQGSGQHEFKVDMKDFSSGMYVYSISIKDNYTDVKNTKFNKMILIK
ncbi:MAG: CotH kinase family protein [bacterium]